MNKYIFLSIALNDVESGAVVLVGGGTRERIGDSATMYGVPIGAAK